MASKPSGGIPITISGVLRISTGSDDVVTVYVAINGAPVLTSGSPVDVPSDTPGVPFATVIWQEEFNDGDTIEVWVANNTDGTDIIIEDATIRIN